MRALCDTLEYEGYQTYGFTSPNEALAAMRERSFDLLLADLQMPGTNGIDLMKSAQLIDPTLVAVIMTGHGALETAIAAMKAGALDFLTKPVLEDNLIAVVRRALEHDRLTREESARIAVVGERLASLTPREHEVLASVIAGRLNKQIAAELTIAEKTVKVHRARVMSKMAVRSVAELVRIVQSASLAAK